MSRLFFLSALVVALLILIGWYEYSLWSRCLQTDPWWYCLRVLVR